MKSNVCRERQPKSLTSHTSNLETRYGEEHMALFGLREPVRVWSSVRAKRGCGVSGRNWQVSGRNWQVEGSVI
ncbi:hypothetical protein L484_000663 [Morus notabilis]|uniref:Uncharacterized protein n=1 Tax=Morus notabilis TaxID=981085 RepID=W9SLR8_9ROSA|nr:hypothetical protein L484_000663 [Morus notabilis]